MRTASQQLAVAPQQPSLQVLSLLLLPSVEMQQSGDGRARKKEGGGGLYILQMVLLPGSHDLIQRSSKSLASGSIRGGQKVS